MTEWLEHGVAVLPGTAFGAFDHWVRLSLATAPEALEKAARTLRELGAREPATRS
jgi:aspartate/methionine/tyrosine aminotransferase